MQQGIQAQRQAWRQHRVIMIVQAARLRDLVVFVVTFVKILNIFGLNMCCHLEPTGAAPGHLGAVAKARGLDITNLSHNLNLGSGDWGLRSSLALAMS